MSTSIPIYTIGYGNRSIEEFVAALRQVGVQYLVDVRSQPYSAYAPDYSRRELTRVLEEAGIRYLFLGQNLGGRPDDPACYTDGKVDYAKYREKPLYQEGIARLRRAWEQQLPVALMCSEGKPENCHRSKLIGVTLDALGIPVSHIDEENRLLSQEEVIARMNGGQLSLFGSDMQAYTSRKRYLKEGEQDDPADA